MDCLRVEVNGTSGCTAGAEDTPQIEAKIIVALMGPSYIEVSGLNGDKSVYRQWLSTELRPCDRIDIKQIIGSVPTECTENMLPENAAEQYERAQQELRKAALELEKLLGRESNKARTRVLSLLLADRTPIEALVSEDEYATVIVAFGQGTCHVSAYRERCLSDNNRKTWLNTELPTDENLVVQIDARA